MIFVTCSNCQTKLRVQDTAAGKQVSCPKCQASVRVPNGQSSAKPATSERSNAGNAGGAWDNLNMDDTQAAGSYGSQTDFFSAPMSDLSTPQSGANSSPVGNRQNAPYSPGYYQPAAQTTTRTTKPTPKTASNETKLPIALLASIAGGGVLALMTLGIVAIGVYFGFGGNQADFIALNAEPQVASDAVTAPPDTSITPQPTTAAADSSPSTVPADENSYVTWLAGDETLHPMTSKPPFWIEVYNFTRQIKLIPYAFQIQTLDGKEEFWTAGRADLIKPGAWDFNFALKAHESFPLLKYKPDPKRRLRVPPNLKDKTPLIVKEYVGPDFEIKRLKPFGLQLDINSTGPVNRSKSFAWSADGKMLFVMQGNVNAEHQTDACQIIRVNASTWEIEASVDYLASDIAVCSEGVVLAIYNKLQTFQKREEPIILDAGFPRFPLHSNNDTNYHLVVLDPVSLELKYSLPVPRLSELVASPNSSRVFASHSGDILLEFDLQRGELVSMIHNEGKYHDLEAVNEQNVVFAQANGQMLHRHVLSRAERRNPVAFPNSSTWNTFSPDRKLVLQSDIREYSVVDAEDPKRTIGKFRGPLFGMAAIDPATKATIAAGLDESGQLTAQIYQETGSWNISLGESLQFAPSSQRLTRKSNPPKLTQAGQPLKGLLRPLGFQLTRTPFFIDAMPNGQGFLIFTLEGAFVIKPLKKAQNFVFDNKGMKNLDLGAQLLDDSAEKARLAPPQTVSQPYNLTRIQNPTKGDLFGFPLGTAVLGATCDPQTGSSYFLAQKNASDKSALPDILVVRTSPIGANNSDTVACTISQLPRVDVKLPTISVADYGGQKCVAVTGESLVWFLDTTTLAPVQFSGVPNPLDLTKEPYLTALNVNPNPDVRYTVENNNSDRLRIIAWQDTTRWLNGIEIESSNGKLLTTLSQDEYTFPGQPDTMRRPLLRDPLKKLLVQSDTIQKNSQVLKAPAMPCLILSGHPWIMGLNAKNLVFMNRSNLAEQTAIELPPNVLPNPAVPNQYVENPKTESIVMSVSQPNMGSLVWFLPIADLNLPQRSFIASDIALPQSLSPGQELKVEAKQSDTDLKVKLVSAPEGLRFENDFIVWKPTESNLGTHKVEFELTAGDERILETHIITVSQPMLTLPFAPINLVSSYDGRFVAACRNLDICFIDTVENKVISTTKVDFIFMSAVLTEDKAIFYLDNNEFREIPYASPTNIKGFKANLPYLNSSTLSNQMIGRGKNTLVFLDYRVDSSGNSIQTLFTYPTMARSPFERFLYNRNGTYGHIAYSNESLLGGVLLDEKEQVTSVLALEWTGMFVGNPVNIFPGAAARSLHSSPIIVGDRGNIQITPTLTARLESKPLPNSDDLTLEWVTDLEQGSTESFGGFVVPKDSVLEGGVESARSILVSDKFFFTAGTNFCSTKIPENIRQASKRQGEPMRVKSKDPLTFLSTSKKEISFDIVGGIPPYTVEAASSWGLYQPALESIQQNNKKIVDATVKASKATIEINGREILPALFKQPSNWMGWSGRIILAAEEAKNNSEKLTAYRTKINESLEDVTKTKCRGVPMGLNLILNVTDSNGQTVSLTHCVIIDFPTEQFLKLLGNP